MPKATEKGNGGPAFPWNGLGDDGMTLRDYFAAKVMAVALTGATAGSEENIPQLCEMVAKVSYQMADAMLKERSK